MESMWVARPATEQAFVLGEGPVWDPTRGRLLWVDIRSGLVLIGSFDGERIRVDEHLQFPGTVGAVTMAADGRLLVAAQEHLVMIDAAGRRSDGPRLLPPGLHRRLNDGKTDPSGRFVVGTLLMDEPGEEALVRLERDGSLTSIDDDLTLSNGLAWSVNGRTLYTVDTYRRTVWRRDYDPNGSATGVRTAFVTVDDGYPDGMCTDSADHVWVAIYGRGEVRRYSPTGALTGVVKVAAPHVSSVAFAGADLRTLVITTATQELSADQLAAFPESGRVFLADVGQAGAPVPYWEPPYETISTAHSGG